MKKIKIAVIGAGSTYTPEIIEGLIEHRDKFQIRELVLMDIDYSKLEIVGNFSRRMLERAGMRFPCILTNDLEDAVYGADYVLAQIRVGGLNARIHDEKIPLKYGFIGQETTGIGGFFKGLRTIPEIMNICYLMEKLCPSAFLINFSNPSGMVAEAVLNNTKIKMMGLCNVPINMFTGIKKGLGISEAEFQYVGLNHLSWITSIKENDKEYLKNVIESNKNFIKLKNIPDVEFDIDCIRMAGGIPSSYLSYYYNRNKELKKLLTNKFSRSEEIKRIEKKLLNIYTNPSSFNKPELLNERGGSLYSKAAITLLDSIENDKKDIHVLNIKNSGALSFMEKDDVVEIASIVGRNGPIPIPITNFNNNHIISLMRVIKQYEKHTINAALFGDVNEAMRALCIHPLVGDYENSRKCFVEMFRAHEEYLPQFTNGV